MPRERGGALSAAHVCATAAKRLSSANCAARRLTDSAGILIETKFPAGKLRAQPKQRHPHTHTLKESRDNKGNLELERRFSLYINYAREREGEERLFKAGLLAVSFFSFLRDARDVCGWVFGRVYTRECTNVFAELEKRARLWLTKLQSKIYVTLIRNIFSIFCFLRVCSSAPNEKLLV